MVVSITNLSVRHGSHYYASEGHSSEPDQHDRSGWYGKLSETLGVAGPVTSESLLQLLQGRSPRGEVLVHKPPLLGTYRERAGVDLTTSAPKSVSLQALVCGDRHLESAHQQVTRQMLSFLEERYAFTRQMQQGQRQRVHTEPLATRFCSTCNRCWKLEPLTWMKSIRATNCLLTTTQSAITLTLIRSGWSNRENDCSRQEI